MILTHFPQSLARALLSLSLCTAPAAAQRLTGDGFMFGAPNATVVLRAGYGLPSAGSDLFSFVTHELSLHRSDFASTAYGADLAVTLLPQWSAVLSIDFDGMNKKSDYREWQDNLGNPIEQTTSFKRQSYMASVRYYFRPYGRRLSKFAWIPAPLVPWASAGAGRTYYRFTQRGDFIDFTHENRVFWDSYQSMASGFAAQASAGLDWNFRPRVGFTTQVKYVYGKADLGIDYSGFAPIDLSGMSMTGGMAVRF